MALRDLWHPGPLAIFITHYQNMLTVYYLLGALILADRKPQEQVFRNAYLQAQVATVAAELLWAWLHPRALGPAACALALAAHGLLQAAHLGLAYAAPLGAYAAAALPLQLAAAVAKVPVGQLGDNHTVHSRVSPQRYKMLAWMATSAITVVSLLVPSLASPWAALPFATVPAAAAAVRLMLAGRHALGPTCGATSTEGCNGRRKAEEAPVGVALQPAAAFVALGCLSGTLGEALTDAAVMLAIRRSMQKGRQELALANQVSIGLSVLLAYLSETSGWGGAERRGCSFALIWVVCQLLRNAALDLLHGGEVGALATAALALMDKYTGPLGTAALETALLAILANGDSQQPGRAVAPAVPGTLLWSARMAASRLERPVCQLILLHVVAVPVQAVAVVLALTTGAGVLATLWRLEAPAAARKAKGE